MQRAVVFLLVPALIAISAVGSTLHMHVYEDHDHPEHHHALAAHHHEVAPAHTNEGADHLEGCDPGAHAVSIPFVTAAPSQVHVATAVLAAPRMFGPDIRSDATVRHSDVRVHGPPRHADISPRAPPAIAHA